MSGLPTARLAHYSGVEWPQSEQHGTYAQTHVSRPSPSRGSDYFGVFLWWFLSQPKVHDREPSPAPPQRLELLPLRPGRLARSAGRPHPALTELTRRRPHVRRHSKLILCEQMAARRSAAQTREGIVISCRPNLCGSVTSLARIAASAGRLPLRIRPDEALRTAFRAASRLPTWEEAGILNECQPRIGFCRLPGLPDYAVRTGP